LATSATVLAYGCFSASLAHVEASRVSAVLALVPLGTLALTTLASRLAQQHFPQEKLSLLSLLGVAGVVAGALVTSLGGEVASSSPSDTPEPTDFSPESG
jgi:drug/metabolite transporter (DMT)-like permease